MVYCSNCGTNNREGSKFCNNCGNRLQSLSGVTCPTCGTTNQVENAFCSNCGARLVPFSTAPAPDLTPRPQPIKGLSLPTKSPAPPREEPTAKAEPSAEGETGDWIQKLSQEELVQPQQPPSPAAEENESTPPAPEWIEQLRASALAKEEEAAATEPSEELQEEEQAAESEQAGEETVLKPSWIEEISSEAQTGPQFTQETVPPSAELTPVEPVSQEPAPAEPGITPNWLLPLSEKAETTEQSPAPVEPGVTPDWLRPTSEKAETTEQPPAPVEPTVAPGWLEQTPGQVETPEQPPAASPTSGQGEIPAQPPAPSTAPGETLTEDWFNPPDEVEVKELPDWLQTGQPAPTSQPTEPITAAQEEIPAGPQIEPAKPDELPVWVSQLKPMEAMPAPVDAEVAGEPIESTGPLTGLRGVLPLASAMVQPHPKPVPARAEPKASGRLFDAILAEPAATERAPKAVPRPRRGSMRPVIYLLLALAVIIPFLLPPSLTGALIPISNTPAAEFYDTLQAVPSNSVALVAFDYDASMTGEMDLQANAVVRDLVRRHVKIVALSTLDTGPQIAQRVLDSATANVSDYQYGVDYLNLGYLPGHEAGLASLAATGLPLTQKDFVQSQNLAAYPLAANVKGIGDVKLIVEFSGSQDALKMWMEQVQPRAGVPIAAGVSAAVEPDARAYRNAHQLVALLGGLMGAAQYETLSSQPGAAVIGVNAQSAAQIVLVFIIILGNVAFWISRARGQAV